CTVGLAVEVIHGIGFVMLGKIARPCGAKTIMHRQCFEKVQTRIAERMLPKNRKPVFLNLPVVEQGPVKIRQRAALRQHRREQNFFFSQPERLPRADQNLYMARWAGVAEFVEHLLRVDFHEVDIFYKKPKMAIESRSIDGVNDRNEGAPVFVK